MMVLYIDSAPLVVGGAADGATWVTATEGELGPMVCVPEIAGGGEECDGTAENTLMMFEIACSYVDG